MTTRYKQEKRAGGKFIGFPAVLLESDAYLNLKPVAQQIYIFVCSQYNGSNNGDMTCTPKALKSKYKMQVSDKTVYRAIADLLDAGVMLRTVQGGKHKASRFAVSIYAIDRGGDMEKETKTAPTYRFVRANKVIKIKSTASLVTAKTVDSFSDDSLKVGLSP